MRIFKYIGRTSKPDKCDDCEKVSILRCYETSSGYIYICPECANTMETDYQTELSAIRGETSG